MFLYDFLVNIVPFTVAAYDAGFYGTFNQPAAKHYLESFIITKEPK